MTVNKVLCVGGPEAGKYVPDVGPLYSALSIVLEMGTSKTAVTYRGEPIGIVASPLYSTVNYHKQRIGLDIVYVADKFDTLSVELERLCRR